MVSKNLPDLVVCNSKKPKGILTFRSIVRAVAEDQDMDKTAVADVIIKDTPILSPKTTIEKAAEMLIDIGLPVLPVIEQQELLGVVSRLDIEDVFLKISQRRPSQEEVQRWVVEAKRHKPISIH